MQYFTLPKTVEKKDLPSGSQKHKDLQNLGYSFACIEFTITPVSDRVAPFGARKACTIVHLRNFLIDASS